MFDGKKAAALSADPSAAELAARLQSPTFSYKDISDGERCEAIVMHLTSAMQIKVSMADDAEAVAKQICDIAEELNGEIKRRGWEE